MAWAAGRQTPDMNLMRFVSRRFAPPGRFLDIGSGEGANARELAARGYLVHTVDKDPEVEAGLHADVCELDFGPIFNLVYDVNTLCHVKEPPFEKIKGWLKPEGVFFSICPSVWSEGRFRIGEGKDFTRFIAEDDLKKILACFFKVEIYEHSYPDFLGHTIHSWIIEARP